MKRLDFISDFIAVYVSSPTFQSEIFIYSFLCWFYIFISQEVWEENLQLSAQ